MDLLGHADNIGTDHYNLVLSVKRANTVLNYLLQKGISGNRLKAVGLGCMHPKTAGDSEQARSLNRRVQLIPVY